MQATLKQEIDARTAGRQDAERENPGCFWGDNGVTLSRAEANVFAIDYADFPRMQSVWDAWFDFLGMTMNGPLFYSREAIERERTLRPELTAGNEPHLYGRVRLVAL